MALIVETGTGLSDAESYCSVAAADARHTAMGNTGWTGADAAKEAALRRATAFMEQRFRSSWKGTKLYRAQALSWPRYGAESDGWPVESTVVPPEVVMACAELAYRAAQGDLNPDSTQAIIREKIGPIETEFDRYSPQTTQYRSVDQLLAPLLRGSSMSAMLIRA